MRRNYLLKIVLVLSILSIYMNITAKERDTVCFLNGRERNDIKVLVKNGESLMPLRTVGEELGAQVDYDSKSKKITITKGKTTLSLTIGEKNVLINNENLELLNPVNTYPIEGQDITYVPLRILFENLGGTVTYNSKYNYINAYDKEHVAYKALEGLKSNDLTEYRFALLALPRYIPDEDVYIGGIYNYSVFPINSKQPYFLIAGNPSLDLPEGNLGYFEVEDGVAICKWHKADKEGDLYFEIEDPLIYFYTNKFIFDTKLSKEELSELRDQFLQNVGILTEDGDKSIPEGLQFEYALQSPYIYSYLVKYIGGESQQYENTDLLGAVDEEALLKWVEKR